VCPSSPPPAVERLCLSPTTIESLRAIRAGLVAELLIERERALSPAEASWWRELRLWCDAHEASLSAVEMELRLEALERRLADQDRERDRAADVVPPHVSAFWERGGQA